MPCSQGGSTGPIVFKTEEAAPIMVGEEAKGTDGPILDLYCGAGVIGLTLAGQGRPVTGFESVSSAIANARDNAALNSIENASFVEGDVLEKLPSLEGVSKPGLVVLDPPRAGLHPKLLPGLIELDAPRLVYVSCNPASAVRDLCGLQLGGYELSRVRPVDLFPHTPHLECVFTLDKKA